MSAKPEGETFIIEVYLHSLTVYETYGFCNKRSEISSGSN